MNQSSLYFRLNVGPSPPAYIFELVPEHNPRTLTSEVSLRSTDLHLQIFFRYFEKVTEKGTVLFFGFKEILARTFKIIVCGSLIFKSSKQPSTSPIVMFETLVIKKPSVTKAVHHLILTIAMTMCLRMVKCHCFLLILYTMAS